jgi:hypothetical protein
MSDAPSPADPFEFFRRLWAPAGAAAPGFVPGMMFPSANLGEIEKRIADLRSVESWLSLNLETVRAMVQGLEAQRATLNAFQTMNQAASSAAEAAAAAAASVSARSATAPPRARRKKSA